MSLVKKRTFTFKKFCCDLDGELIEVYCDEFKHMTITKNQKHYGLVARYYVQKDKYHAISTLDFSLEPAIAEYLKTELGIDVSCNLIGPLFV